MASELPPQVQNQLVQLQQLQQQAQVVVAQRSQMEAQVSELERTFETLSKVATGSAVFRGVGSVLVEVKDVEALRKELADEKETMEVRLGSARKNETRLRERITSQQREIQVAPGAPR